MKYFLITPQALPNRPLGPFDPGDRHIPYTSLLYPLCTLFIPPIYPYVLLTPPQHTFRSI